MSEADRCPRHGRYLGGRPCAACVIEAAGEAAATAALLELLNDESRCSFCVYCGRPFLGRLACSEHRPLLAVDPFYVA